MISIIIPIYNAEKELERMIASIKQQSYTDFEVIMIDDGSKDDSAKICKRIVAEDGRFKYYHQENSGVSTARNNGLKKAIGEYIAFVDADDEIETNYLEVLLNSCAESDIAVCDTVIKRNEEKIARFTGDFTLTRDKALNLLLSRKVINSGPCSKLYKKEAVDGIFFPSIKTYEDILFNLEVFNRANSVEVTSKTRYYYIENLQGAMSKMKKSPSKDIIVASRNILEFIKNNTDIIDAQSLYITVSHVFQYVLTMVGKECEWNTEFIKEAKLLFKNYVADILKCTAVPWKEKVVFVGFIFGWVYTNKHWFYVNKMR